MPLKWQWLRQDPAYVNFGNANQWAVDAGFPALARESAQNSNDARLGSEPADLVYTFTVLRGDERADFEDALNWKTELAPHLSAMSEFAVGAVAAGQIKAGLDDVETASDLLLLRIDDYGCQGLTGPEFPDSSTPKDAYGNFIKLCRGDLFSGKDQASGGSFGLGKAVYWRYSRLQTVLFNSRLSPADAVDGRTANRLFGVNQGSVHTLWSQDFQGRGYFGLSDGDAAVRSAWGNSELVRRLHLQRHSDRPGTSALMIGFYDPDRPNLGLHASQSDLETIVGELRSGIEESFWPLLTRGRLRVRIDLTADGRTTSVAIDPEETYSELVRALRRFDAGDLDQELAGPYSVVARDVSIQIARRKTGDTHDTFTHMAKLVATVSDDQKDSLENRVCLFRRPEMVVETIDRSFEGRTYHAFLLAGAAIDPADPSVLDLRADDFLRFAEPPPHNQWIPVSGRGQKSQGNLTANYVAPWKSHLTAIRTNVLAALFELFGTPPPAEDKGPESVLKHMRFLRADPGPGPGRGGRSSGRKPTVRLTSWRVLDGTWHVEAEITANNREKGWLIRPELAFFGLDGGHVRVEWTSLTGEGCIVTADKQIALEGRPRGRKLRATLSGITTANLPIPAEDAAVDIVLTSLGTLRDRSRP